MLTNEEIGKEIRKNRLKQGLTQEQLGEKFGIGKSAVAKWEKGIVKNIKRDTLQRLAECLNMSPLTLVGYSETEKPAKTVFYEEFSEYEMTKINEYINFIKSQRK